MPLREETYNLAEEVDRIEAELQDIAEQVADLDANNPARQDLLEDGQSLDAQLKGVRWAKTAHEDDAVGVWDADTDEIRLGGLTGGEFGRLQDDISGADLGQGGVRTIMVARGTLDAPYVPADGDEDQAVGNTSQLPVTYLKWAQNRINDLTTLGGNGGPGFEDYLEAAHRD